MMRYKGYVAQVTFDEEADLFHGEVVNIRDVVTFQGKSVAELKKALRDSVDDYLAYCRKRGESPSKPFSGRFVLRVTPELHQRLTVAAIKAKMSLNAWIADRLEAAAPK
jgi:predicted HicB family RNase H-like nuclease